MLTTVAEAQRAVAPVADGDTGKRVAAALLRHRWALGTTSALVVIFLVNGIPLDATALLVFGMTIFLIDALTTRGLTATAAIAKDWVPLLAVLFAYGLTNGFANSVGMPLQVEALVNADKLLFLGEVPTVWLQERLVGTNVAWWEVTLTLVYCSHFFLSPAVLLWLYKRDRTRWSGLVRRFLTLNGFGLLTYVLVPAAPPWWASERGEIGPVARVLGRGWSVIGLDSAGGIMTTGQQRVNEVAAIPSLHAGYSLLVTLALWRTARRTRWLLALYPFAMGFTLVYGGEHYVIDILLGWLYAAGVMALWKRIDGRRAAGAPSSSDVPQPLPSAGA